jgi:hypothetical protein
MIKSGAGKQLNSQCPPNIGGSPYRLTYTGSHSLDKQLCILVAFFQSGLTSSSTKAFVGYFLSQFPSFLMLPVLQALRPEIPHVLRYSTIIGLLYQNYGGAFVVPLYCALLLTVGGPDISLNTNKVDVRVAEGTLMGLIFGYLLPTVWMYRSVKPRPTAFWQLFPLWMYVSKLLWIAFRQATGVSLGHPSSSIINAIYALNILISSLAHIAYVWPRLLKPATLSETFVPTVSPPDRQTTTLRTGVVHFLKWDGIIIVGSIFALSGWFMETWTLVAQAAAWLIGASIIIGPGSALSALLLWRSL